MRRKSDGRGSSKKEFDEGYETALEDLAYFSAEGRTAPFRAITQLGDARRGSAKKIGERTFETRLEQTHREFTCYLYAKKLIEERNFSAESAFKETHKFFHRHSIPAVKKIYLRLRKEDISGKLFAKTPPEIMLRERRFNRAINAINIIPPVYGHRKAG
jgi:hypothetical protein